MVQFIPLPEDRSVKMGQQLAGVIDAGIQGYEQGKETKLRNEERKNFKEKFGFDLSRDPQIAKVQVAEGLKGERKKQEFKDFMDYVNSKKNKPITSTDNETNVSEPDSDIDPMEKYILGQINPLFGQFAAKDEAEARADRRAEKKLKTQKEQFEATAEQKQKEMFHKESKKYYDKVHENAKEATLANQALLRQKKLVGEIGWLDRAANFLKPELRNIVQSDSAVEFDSNITNLIGSKKSKFGGVLTTPKLNLLLSKLATSAKSKQANEYIIDYNILENDMEIAEQEIADQIMKENNGYRPANFQGLVAERLKNLYQDRAEDLYEKVSKLPDDPERLKQVWRKKVPQGTPLTQEIADKYIEMFGEKEAPIKAEEDGWIFRK